jgi:hypothetical protein
MSAAAIGLGIRALQQQEARRPRARARTPRAPAAWRAAGELQRARRQLGEGAPKVERSSASKGASRWRRRAEHGEDSRFYAENSALEGDILPGRGACAEQMAPWTASLPPPPGRCASARAPRPGEVRGAADGTPRAPSGVLSCQFLSRVIGRLVAARP